MGSPLQKVFYYLGKYHRSETNTSSRMGARLLVLERARLRNAKGEEFLVRAVNSPHSCYA